MEQAVQAGFDLWPIIGLGITIVTTGLFVMGFQWRMSVAMENRIKENADQAHAQIGENINRVEKHLGEIIQRSEAGLNQRIRDLRSDIKDLTERFDRHLEHHS